MPVIRASTASAMSSGAMTGKWAARNAASLRSPTQRGVDEARADGVDGDALLGQLRAQGPDQSDHGVLGQGVDRVRGIGDQAGQRRGGDDRAAAPSGHRRHHGPDPEHHAVHVGPHDPPVLLVGQGADVGLAGRDAGVEEGQVDPARLVLDPGDRRRPRRPVRPRRSARTSRPPRPPRPARRSSSTSSTATRAPSAASRRTVARPMPEAPPVTTATLPSSTPMAIAYHQPGGDSRPDRSVASPPCAP